MVDKPPADLSPFQLKQPNLQAYSETDHSSVLTNILHRSSREINIPVQIQTSDYQVENLYINCLVGRSAQLDLSPAVSCTLCNLIPFE